MNCPACSMLVRDGTSVVVCFRTEPAPNGHWRHEVFRYGILDIDEAEADRRARAWAKTEVARCWPDAVRLRIFHDPGGVPAV